MNGLAQLSWDNFRTTVLVRAQKRTHRVSESPLIEIFGDGIGNRIGIALEVPVEASVTESVTRLASVQARLLNDGGRTFLEVATNEPLLQREFYYFAAAVAERVIVDQRPVLEALEMELKCFTGLFRERSLLGIERQIGLLGELVFLDRVVCSYGPEAIDSWLGPLGEPHDFRTGAHEFEVKTTVSPRRVHTINGTEQLVPSTGCLLYLVSILLGPGGLQGGFSLAGKVADLGAQFQSTPRRLEQFGSALQACGYREEDREHYTRLFSMRRPIAIVPVDNEFPAISRNSIQKLLGPRAVRVEALQYDVNVEGLEHEDGSPAFVAVMEA